MRETDMRAGALTSSLIALSLCAAGPAVALTYDDLDVLYAEDFTGESAMSSLTPEVDVFGAGRLFELDQGNGQSAPPPFTAVTFVPGAAQLSVATTHPFGASAEQKILTFDTSEATPFPAVQDVGVRGTFANLGFTSDSLYGVDTVLFAGQVGGKFVAWGVAFQNLGGGPQPLLVLAEGTAGNPTTLQFTPVPSPVASAILSGGSYRLTLVIDRAGGEARGELLVGATTVTSAPLFLSLVTPTDPLAFPGVVFEVRNFSGPTDLSAGTDSAVVDFQSFEARGIEPPAPPPLDVDGDGVVDADDNCPTSHNPSQTDGDEDGADGVGDVCDNCESVANPSQTDINGNKVGDACDAGVAETLEGPASAVPPGGPIWVSATLFPAGQAVGPLAAAVGTQAAAGSVVTIEPNCCNTYFRIDDGEGGPLAPNHVLCDPPVIPRDYRVFEPGESHTVTCDVSEFYAPETLVAVNNSTVDLTAIYDNFVTDPDCYPPDPAAPAYVPVPADCIEAVTGAEAFLGSVVSAPIPLTFAGDPILPNETVTGQCSVTPATWYAQWAVTSGPAITFTLSGLPAGVAALIAPASIRLNGSAAIVPSSAMVSGGNLTFQIPRNAAVQSLASVTPGTTELPQLTGAVLAGSGFEQFRATCPVSIAAAIAVEIDIKPDSTENTINLGSNGAIPVAILSSPTFAASTVNPTSVTLANATVKVKGKGTPMFSLTDVNEDGLTDMLVHISTTGLELSETSESADLAGMTTGGTPIFGTDSVRIVP